MIHPDFVKQIVEKLPVDVTNILRQYGPKICVAGGFCRDVVTGAEPKDVDLFGVNQNVMSYALFSFTRNAKYYGNSRKTKNATSYRPMIVDAVEHAFAGKPYRVKVDDGEYGPEFIVKTVLPPDGLVLPVQFITGKNFFPTHEDLIKSFDFTICQAAVYYEPDKKSFIGVATPAFWDDVTNGTLHYTAPNRREEPGGSVLRMVRFAQRGWKVSEEEVAKCVGRFYYQLTQKQLPENTFPKDEPQAIQFVSSAFSHVAY